MPKKGVKMTDAVITSAEVGNRIANWLRQAYPRDGAKLAAREFDASPHTTRRWFEGCRPENKHFDQMVKKWGSRFFEFVYSPVPGQGGPLGISEELASLRSDVDSLKRSLLRGPFNIGALPLASRGASADDDYAAELGGDQARSTTASIASQDDITDAAE